ncbi:Phage-associated protein [Lactococcus cremoris]|nr:Phage-associated protein [Lactococcus cremoris]
MYEAAKLNEKLKEVVEQLIELNEISNVSLNSDYNFTDTETKEYRYQAVFDINHY